MKIHILKIKAEQKVRAQEIRNLKSKRKELKGYVPGLEGEQQEYRTYHIAYCMLRGRTLEQIEPKLRDPNSYTHVWVRKGAAKIVADILNPKPPVVETPVVVETKKEETIWNKVQNFLS